MAYGLHKCQPILLFRVVQIERLKFGMQIMVIAFTRLLATHPPCVVCIYMKRSKKYLINIRFCTFLAFFLTNWFDYFENRVVSGSRDATLRVWDIVQGKCLHTLVGHLAAVRCVQYDGKLVVSGAYDYMVKVWNPETEECLHTLQGHTNRVYSLQVEFFFYDIVHILFS